MNGGVAAAAAMNHSGPRNLPQLSTIGLSICVLIRCKRIDSYNFEVLYTQIGIR
jgi:hypothetical protein